jgi:hypothetical protein
MHIEEKAFQAMLTAWLMLVRLGIVLRYHLRRRGTGLLRQYLPRGTETAEDQKGLPVKATPERSYQHIHRFDPL